MAQKKKTQQNDEPEQPRQSQVIPQSITEEMENSYLDYAMSVITARALPDVRDGLKPVHRRILFAMHELGLSSGAKFRKSATVVGDVLGKYHPHGDMAVYDAMVKMAQPFTYRYPLVIGQGNFGSPDGDSAAAMRYTEAKMSSISAELLRDLEKDTVEWRSNYDGTRKEPTVLPCGFPHLLVNGTLGIAVGMATNIPPHNLREVIDATVHLIDNDNATTDDLLSYIKGPDFPTGAVAFNQQDIRHAYANGKGSVVVRGEADITEGKKGQNQIVVTSLPYRVNKADLIVKIADMVRNKKLEGIKDLRDESTHDVRVVIDLKSGAQPQKVLNYLYKHTQLEETFHYNCVALVDGVPQTLSITGLLEQFIEHRREVVRRRTEFDLRKAEDREHILIGLKKALDHIDEIIQTIKKSRDTQTAHKNLMKQFSLSDRQATAILEMRLQKLAGLERKKIENELKEVQQLIKRLKEILGSEQKMMQVIKDELQAVSDKYGDDRRTKIVKSGVKSLSAEDLVPDEENVLVLTNNGYVKRTPPSEYKSQKRGGVGVVDVNTKDEDYVTRFLTANTHNDILFFSDRGKAYQIKMHELPEGKKATRGKSVMNYIGLESGETVTSVLAMPKNVQSETLSMMMVTKQGVVKKVAAKDFYDVRRNGLIAIKLSNNDELISTHFVDQGDDVVLMTAGGQAIRFKESDVREMGRSAGGVRGIALDENDEVVSAAVVQKGVKNAQLLVVSEMGYGKKTKLSEFKTQKRGGAGIKAAKLGDKTGTIVGSQVIIEGSEELIAISKKGQAIRIGVDEVSTLNRQTQGVRIMKLRQGDGVAALVCF
jgi:DNA gyrase subunit A